MPGVGTYVMMHILDNFIFTAFMIIIVVISLILCGASAEWGAQVVAAPYADRCMDPNGLVANSSFEIYGVLNSTSTLYDGAPPAFDGGARVSVRVYMSSLCACTDPGLDSLTFAIAIEGAHVYTCSDLRMDASNSTLGCSVTCDGVIPFETSGYHRLNVYAIPASGSRPVHIPAAARLAGISHTSVPTGIIVRAKLPKKAVYNRVAVPGKTVLERAELPRPRVSAYYTTLNQITAQIMQNISKVLGPEHVHTAEDVLRSNGSLTMDSIVIEQNETLHYPWPEGEINWYQDRSQIGIYGLWRHRPGRPAGVPIPDFPAEQVRQAIRWHARIASAAGIDALTFDASNWCVTDDPITDVRQQGPTLQVFEELARLRREGEKTPSLTVFHRLTGTCDLWQWYLDRFFNNETFSDIVMREQEGNMTSKKVFFISNEREATNFTTLAAVAANGGRHDVLPVYNWKVQGGPGNTSWWQHDGSWTYLSSCTNTSTGTGNRGDASLDYDGGHSTFPVQRTTSINYKEPCRHYRTEHSPLGSEYTISKEDATMGLPFSSPGVLGGLHMKLQFYDAMSGSVDNIFSPSFNEYQIRPNNLSTWANKNPFLHVAGRFGDDDAHLIFNDGYTAGRNRNLEPSVTDKGYSLELYASCVRVLRLQYYLREQDKEGLAFSDKQIGSATVGRSQGHEQEGLPAGTAAAIAAARHTMASCTVAGELCCTLEADQAFVPVWYLDRGTPGTSTALSSDYAEVMRWTGGVTSSNGAPRSTVGEVSHPFVQRCNPWSGPTGTFCANETIAYDSTRYREVSLGPFSALDYWMVREHMPENTAVLYRCEQYQASGAGTIAGVVASDGPFVHGTDPTCGGLGVPGSEMPIAVIATRLTGHFPRVLRQCRVQQATDADSSSFATSTAAGHGYYYISVDAACLFDGADAGVLGYVV